MLACNSEQVPLVVLQLGEEFPCPPQELVFRQYAPLFELGDTPPFLLTASVFPSLKVSASTLAAATSADDIGGAVQKLGTLALPSIPLDNIREDIRKQLDASQTAAAPTTVANEHLPLFPFPRCIDTVISSSCLCRSTTSSCHHDAVSTAGATPGLPVETLCYGKIVTGLTTGAILLWELDAYQQHLRSLRLAKRHGAGSSASYSTRAWGTAKPPAGVTLLGCQMLGAVTCVDSCDDGRLLVSGSADGSVYLWDMSGALAQSRLNLTLAAASTAGSEQRVLDVFAETIHGCNLLVRREKAHGGAVTAVGALSDTFITGGADRIVCIWRLRNGSTDPAARCYVSQTFQMHGWVRSVEPFSLPSSLDDEYIVTDDAGWVLRLQSTRPFNIREGRSAGLHAHLSRKQNSTSCPLPCEAVSAAVDLLTSSNVFIEKWHLHAQSEETRRLGFGARNASGESSDTVVRTLTIGEDRLIVSIGFSPVVQVMDTHSLHPVLRITHPSLTAEAAPLAIDKPLSWVAGGSRETSREAQGDSGESNVGSSLCAARNRLPLHSPAPLRFIDIAYLVECDGLLLLDNRNSIFLYDRSLSRFVAYTRIPAVAHTGEPQQARSLLTLPPRHSAAWATHPTAQCRIPFLVVCDRGVWNCFITSSETLVVNTTAHIDAVTGVVPLLRNRQHQSSHPRHLESLMGEIIHFISVSRDAVVCCLDQHLKVKRSYNGQLAVAVTTSGDMMRVRTAGDVTSFCYSVDLGYAMTGHETGTVCFWNCQDETPDVVICPQLHSNSVTGFAEVAVDPCVARKEDMRVITIGFDGFIASWKNVAKRKPVVVKRHRLSWSELTSVEVIAGIPLGALAVGDQSGAFFVLDAKELTPLFMCSDQRLTVVPAPRWKQCGPSLLHTGHVEYGHKSGIAAMCVVSQFVITADESGVCLGWDMNDPFKPPMLVPWPGSVEKSDIDCMCSLHNGLFVLAVRGGVLLLFDAAAGATFTGCYRCGHDVSTLTAVYDDSDNFSLVIGTQNGDVALVSGSLFCL